MSMKYNLRADNMAAHVWINKYGICKLKTWVWTCFDVCISAVSVKDTHSFCVLLKNPMC